jgi:regulator of replication initiation timing
MLNSEVARLRLEITLFYQACLSVFESPGITAPHAFITARMEKISDCQAQLISLVGSDAATRITAQAMDEAGEEGPEMTDKDTRKATMTIMERAREITRLKEQVASSFHACMQLYTSSGTVAHQAALKSHLKDMVGYQKELTTLAGANEAMLMMFEAMEGGENVSL